MIMSRYWFAGNKKSNEKLKNIWLFDENSKLVNSERTATWMHSYKDNLAYKFPELMDQTFSQIQLQVFVKCIPRSATLQQTAPA
jgi:hypothetical protein